MSNLQTSLRARLRNDTRLLHEKLDREVSEFDLTTPGGLSGFIRMQFSALQAFNSSQMLADTGAMVQDLCERAALDLRALDASVQPSPYELGAVEPLAVEYVVAGSRLGSQLLKKRWQRATNQQVRRASAYFSAPSYIEIWAAFCERTEAMSSCDPLADRIVQDANNVFNMYYECARASRLVKGTIHA